jgi:hemin uptake protein HemP
MNDSTEPLDTKRPVSQASPSKTLDSATLFDGKSEVLINHRGETYRLRITRQDKLILTK